MIISSIETGCSLDGLGRKGLVGAIGRMRGILRRGRVVILSVVGLSILIAGHGQRTSGEREDWRRGGWKKSAQASGEIPLRMFRWEESGFKMKRPELQHQCAVTSGRDQRTMPERVDEGTKRGSDRRTRPRAQPRPQEHGQARRGRARQFRQRREAAGRLRVHRAESEPGQQRATDTKSEKTRGRWRRRDA